MKERRPDVLTVQFGLHSCQHSHQSSLSDDLSIANSSMIERHIDDIPRLMKSIRTAIERPGENRTRLVIVLTSGAGGVENGTFIDECILRFNRATAEEAHKQGFAVLERGEIERRLLVKSKYAKNPFLSIVTHLQQPAMAIVATSLLKLITCLKDEKFDIYSPALLSSKANTR